jgi:hypothetical protein
MFCEKLLDDLEEMILLFFTLRASGLSVITELLLFKLEPSLPHTLSELTPQYPPLHV